MAINPSVPAKTVPEFIAWAKSKPKQVFFATSGAGNTPHMSGEMSASTEQINWVLTSYIIAAAIMTPITGWLAGRLVFVRAATLDRWGRAPAQIFAAATPAPAPASPLIAVGGAVLEAFPFPHW